MPDPNAKTAQDLMNEAENAANGIAPAEPSLLELLTRAPVPNNPPKASFRGVYLPLPLDLPTGVSVAPTSFRVTVHGRAAGVAGVYPMATSDSPLGWVVQPSADLSPAAEALWQARGARLYGSIQQAVTGALEWLNALHVLDMSAREALREAASILRTPWTPELEASAATP